MTESDNRVVVVTGGSRGIGRAICAALGAPGTTVYFNYNSDLVAAQTTAAGIEAAGGKPIYHQVDVASESAVADYLGTILKESGRIDVLVNNAGVLRDGQLVKVKEGQLVKQMAEEDFDLVIRVNLKGVFNCTQAVAPHMINQGSGVILNASSIVGLDGNFGQTNYVATKAGVVGMTKVWARELGRYGIRVNVVAPGFIATEMVQAMPEKILAGMKGRTPLNRLGQPEDVANAYLFLASEQASFISGAVLRVDGGIVIGT